MPSLAAGGHRRDDRFDGSGRNTTQDLADLLPGRGSRKFNTIRFENYATARARAVPAACSLPATTRRPKGGDGSRGADQVRPGGRRRHGEAEVARMMLPVWFALTQAHRRGVGFAVSLG
jgi:hypothetical protein